MAVTATDAIVLQAFPYGETSRIVRLLTREIGLHSAIAKGALRPRSRYALMEPFAEGVASLYIKPTRDLQTLGGFELACSRQALARDLLRFGGASLLAEIVLRTGSEEPNPELYDAVSSALDLLMKVDATALESTVLAAAWHVIALLGFTPELDACIACSVAIDAAVAASFDYAAGGLRCADCAAGTAGRRVPAHARAALSSFIRGVAVPMEVSEGHWRLLTRYLEHHLLEGSQLRSMQFLAETLSAG